MKKIIFIITILFILIVPSPIYASAGGGSAGGSSSGSSSGHPHNYNNGSSTPQDIIKYTVISVVLGNMYAIVRLYLATKRHTKNVTLLKQFENTDEIWNKKNLKKRVKEVFYATQYAWTDQDCEAFKPYLTEDLYDNWCTKINWQIYNNTRNILDHIHLISIHFIDVYDDEDDSQDCFCVYIQALMVDYMIDVYGQANKSKMPGMLYEFWYFRRIGNTFYLEKIKQVDEVNL